jgi:polysaccharide export outer membrane protein
MKCYAMWFLVAILAVMVAPGQGQPVPLPPADLNQRLLQMAGGSKPTGLLDYHIGPEDLLEVSVFEVPELSRSVRVSASGEISLPLIGAFPVVGLSPVELEQELKARLKRTYVKDPQVSVFLKEFKSDPVSVVGAVKMPGLYTIQTRKSLIELLAMAQGFQEGMGKQPGRTIIVMRKANSQAVSSTMEPAGIAKAGAEPGSGTTAAKSDGTSAEKPSETRPGSSNTASPDPAAESNKMLEIPIKGLLESGDPKWNVPIYPGDVIKVIPAGTVYVIGDVNRPGGFPLTDFDNISALQAVAMAGGTTKAASKKNSVVIRRDTSGNRIEMKVDLGKVLKGGDTDVMLGPNDILFVPGSIGKESALRALELSLQTAAGVLIYKPL